MSNLPATTTPLIHGNYIDMGGRKIPEKIEFDIITRAADGTERVIPSSQFYEVALKRNLKNVDALMNARKEILDGEIVDGLKINMKGLTFRKEGVPFIVQLGEEQLKLDEAQRRLNA